MNITKEMASRSLRPNVAAYGPLGVPSEAEIEAERARLTKSMNEDEKKALKRQAHPVQADDLADEIEGLKSLLNSQGNTINQLTARVAALESKGK